MNLLPHPFIRSGALAPLHTMLLNFGKKQREAEDMTPPSNMEIVRALELLRYDDPKALERRTREMTVKQLATILRMHSEEGDDVTMLNALESLVLAGEIDSKEFIARVECLFPEAMAGLDISMRMKIAALVL